MLLVAASALLWSQVANQGGSTPAVITFTLDFPQSRPAHYSISVDASGHAIYECAAKVAEDSEDEPYRAEFEVSTATRQKIFEWARQAQFFAGKIDSGNNKLAFTGTKSLSFHDGQRSNQAQFNYSKLEPVQQLTVLFQNMAGTQEFGHRLDYYHRYQKLALDDELKHMEREAKSNELSEIAGVATILRQIADDPSVMNVVRARAQKLIRMAKGDDANH